MFFCVCSERYSEQVDPLLVQAQRKLLERVEYHQGPPAPQPHFQHLGNVTAKDYSTLQLTVGRTDDYDGAEIGPGAMMDPTGSDVYSGT